MNTRFHNYENANYITHLRCTCQETTERCLAYDSHRDEVFCVNCGIVLMEQGLKDNIQ